MSRRCVRELPSGFESEVDIVDEHTWNEMLDKFTDANVYQSWTYGEVRAGSRNVSRMVLRRNGEVVATAQARVIRIPLLGIGIAYVRWGPLWQLRGSLREPEVARHAIRALRNEYACRRGLVLRLNPAAFEEDAEELPRLLADEGFIASSDGDRERTIIVDLTHSLEALRAGMRPHWRRQLRIAEKQGLDVIAGTGDDLFDEFVTIYEEMLRRKQFPEPNDINEFRAIQHGLPDRQKMRVLLCRSGSATCAGLMCSVFGNTGVYLFGATSDGGLETRGSYLLHWRLIESLKAEGAAFYDLHGINPVRNPGGYRFKSDLSGENGRHLQFIGRFDCPGSFLSSISVKTGEAMRRLIHAVKGSGLRMAHKPGQDAAVKSAGPPS